MQKTWAIVIPLVVVVVIAAMTFGLYMLGDDESSALEKLRDIMIVYLGLLWVIVVLLLAVLVGVLIWVALMLKDKVIPLLQTIQETVARLKGTAEFMSEEVASPVISFYGSVAKARAMSKAFTGHGTKKKKKTTETNKEAGRVTRLLRKDADLD